MARKSRKKAKGSTVSLNLSGVETRKTPKEGEYLVSVKEVTQEEGDKADYFKWVFGVEGGKFDGAQLYLNTSLSEKSLWNLKALLEALGVEIPDEEFDLDLEEMAGLKLMVTVEHESYEGKKQARIVDFWSADDSDGGSDDEEAPDFDEMDVKALKKFIKANKLDVDPDDHPKEKKLRVAVQEAFEAGSDEEDDAPDFDEMDEDDLAKFIKKNKLDVDIDDLSVKKARKAVAEAFAEAGDDDDDKKGGKKKKDAVPQDDINGMDEDELEAFNDEHRLDVKLDKYKTVKKKRAAIIDAGTEAGVVEAD